MFPFRCRWRNFTVHDPTNSDSDSDAIRLQTSAGYWARYNVTRESHATWFTITVTRVSSLWIYFSIRTIVNLSSQRRIHARYIAHSWQLPYFISFRPYALSFAGMSRVTDPSSISCWACSYDCYLSFASPQRGRDKGGGGGVCAREDKNPSDLFLSLFIYTRHTLPISSSIDHAGEWNSGRGERFNFSVYSD